LHGHGDISFNIMFLLKKYVFYIILGNYKIIHTICRETSEFLVDSHKLRISVVSHYRSLLSVKLFSLPKLGQTLRQLVLFL
jgi:hypothetical protein